MSIDFSPDMGTDDNQRAQVPKGAETRRQTGQAGPSPMPSPRPGEPMPDGGPQQQRTGYLDQSEPPEPREQLQLELPDSEPAQPRLPQTTSPDSEVMPSSSQALRVGHRRLLPKWTGWVLLGLGVVTLPWVAGLAVELPSRSEAAHYDVSWAGFDVLLCVLLLRTGWSALHDLEHVEVTAAMTGSLLIVDAWFDVMSAPNTRQFLIALAMALCVELPLAGFCLWIAGRVEFERRRRSEVLTALVRRFENRRRNRTQRPVPASTPASTSTSTSTTTPVSAPALADRRSQRRRARLTARSTTPLPPSRTESE